MVPQSSALRLQPVVGKEFGELSRTDSLGVRILRQGRSFLTFLELAGMCLLALVASPLRGGMVRDCGRLH